MQPFLTADQIVAGAANQASPLFSLSVLAQRITDLVAAHQLQARAGLHPLEQPLDIPLRREEQQVCRQYLNDGGLADLNAALRPQNLVCAQRFDPVPVFARPFSNARPRLTLTLAPLGAVLGVIAPADMAKVALAA